MEMVFFPLKGREPGLSRPGCALKIENYSKSTQGPKGALTWPLSYNFLRSLCLIDNHFLYFYFYRFSFFSALKGA